MPFKSIWSRLLSLNTAQRLHPGVREIQGVVVKQGINPKTVTVRAWWKTWNFRYRMYFRKGKNYQVHDEENFSRIGDVVVIKSCGKISNTKSYYVRNFLKVAPRFDSWDTLGAENSKALDEKLYEVETPEGNLVDQLKVRALRQRLLDLRASRILDSDIVEKA